MMQTAPRSAHRRINLIFAMILLLGIGISFIVYVFGQRISHSTRMLINDDIPVYAQFQALQKQLSEQERDLYEYYASFDATLYSEAFMLAQAEALAIIDSLEAHYGAIAPLNQLRDNQQNITALAAEFHRNMARQPDDGTDWDLAREQLFDISSAMRALTPYIDNLKQITADNVAASQRNVESHLLTVNVFVITYGLISLIIALLTGRAIKAYLASSAISQRLSLFPKRNPNPIISLDTNNQITFTNPASRRLLHKLQRDPDDFTSLLAPDLPAHQQAAQQDKNHFVVFEYQLDNTHIRCALHWLADQMQWDLHLTDVTAQKQAEQELQFQAYHNQETGLDNQYRFKDVLSHACVQQSRFTLGLIDIHSYTQMLTANTLTQTSRIMVETAAVIHKACHDMNQNIEMYQLGDSMFALRIPDADCDADVASLVNTIKIQVRLTRFTGQNQVELDFGFACYPRDADNVDELLKHARVALETAATDEHLSFYQYDDALGNRVKRQQSLLLAMRTAIAEQHFQLYFQPQLSLTDNRIIGAEVLIRWHREDEWVSPAEFIPLAEQSGLIIPLGSWILKTACQKAKQLVELGFDDLVIAVNISPKQFGAPDFVDSVKAALREAQLPARNLELEITEGVLFNQETDIIKTLATLKDIGVMLAIDDFGTGYSSLSYLKDFPVDKLKIDQSFVRHMHTDTADQSIVRTVIDLGNNLGLTLIAEGVEEQSHVDLLRDMGCDEIQGYWFSKPLDEGYFTYFLQSQQAAAPAQAQ